MPRYIALLRGVNPMNAKMTELKRCFEAIGFSDVRTILSSGNVVFNTRSTLHSALKRRIETAMAAELDRSFETFVRSPEQLQTLVASDPFAEFNLPAQAKPVVTFFARNTDKKIEAAARA